MATCQELAGTVSGAALSITFINLADSSHFTDEKAETKRRNLLRGRSWLKAGWRFKVLKAPRSVSFATTAPLCASHANSDDLACSSGRARQSP